MKLKPNNPNVIDVVFVLCDVCVFVCLLCCVLMVYSSQTIQKESKLN